MVEEFYGKISRSGSNLSDSLEDKLTGDFFGTLRYMDFCDGLQPILCGALRKSEKQQAESQAAIQLIENVNCTNIKDEEHIKFWPKHDRGELDVLLEFDNCYIGIEVKFQSGLSSDDQLIREANILCDLPKDKKKILLFIAKHESCISIYRKYKKDISKQGVHFVFASWEDILQSMKDILNGGKGSKYTFGQKLMIRDLVRLLTRKDFDTFLSMTNGIADKLGQLIEKDVHVMLNDKNYKDYTTNYKNAAYVVFMTYKNVEKLREAIKSKSEEYGYVFIKGYEEKRAGIVDDIWLTFSKEANTGSGDTSLYAVNIFLTNTNEKHPSDPIFRVLRYISPNAISKNLTRENLADAFDKNADAERDTCGIVVDEIPMTLHQRDINNPKDYAGLQGCYYVDLPLMSISNDDIVHIFHIFDELSKQSDIAYSQQATNEE
ncbi:PD-(D/E)XK nuclease family protein [Selenomonas sp. CM52]|uniref:PD-(D/E)XK nuclease family protein n=1 Tax=Selenomonas sp. CM52 TaxID=936381 RepID=UPI00027C57DE|nr:PD-(D/E)XK nuclease family protein [Selenomonas sp. CM52]EJU26635.1 PD-(D/E)XK nuclease domain protein [Selenomonas sp. CM52]